MLLDLEGVLDSKVNFENASVEKVDVGSWLQAWCALSDRHFEEVDVHKELLEKSKLAHLFLLKQDIHGDPMSSGMAVYANRAMGLFGISTTAAHRKMGYAVEIINSLLYWGIKKGAKFAYLQVEESNRAAIELYQKLGFRKSYSYWYRVRTPRTNKRGAGA